MHRALCQCHIQKSCFEIGAKALHLGRVKCTPIGSRNPVPLEFTQWNFPACADRIIRCVCVCCFSGGLKTL
jgi:hypothetical protein